MKYRQAKMQSFQTAARTWTWCLDGGALDGGTTQTQGASGASSTAINGTGKNMTTANEEGLAVASILSS